MNCTLASSTSRASVDLPEPLTPVIATRRLQRQVDRHVLQVVQRRRADRQQRIALALAPHGRRRHRRDGATRLQRMHQRTGQEAPGHRVGLRRELAGAALGHEAAAALAGARPDVDDVVGGADRFLVVLDDDQRVALVGQVLQGIEQDAVVARVQADGRLVEHVADALQVRAELRRQPDALRLAARERGRGAVEREVAQAHFLEEFEAAPDLGDHVARDLGFAPHELQRSRPTCAHRPPTTARSTRSTWHRR